MRPDHKRPMTTAPHTPYVPPPPPSYRLVAADELGLLKVADVPGASNWQGMSVVLTWGQPDREAAVQAMALAGQPGDEEACTVVAVSRCGGVIHIMDSDSGVTSATIQPPPAAARPDSSASAGPTKSPARGPEAVPCLAFLRSGQQASTSGRLDLLSCTASGVVRLHRGTAAERHSGGAATADGEAAVPPPATSSTFTAWEQATSFQTCKSVAAMALSASQSLVALGGDGCHLQLWDLATQQQTFLAKASKPDRVGLMDLPHVTCATFLPGDGGETQIVVGTGAHKLLLYDTRAGRRPQSAVSWGESRITALVAEHDGLRVWAGNGLGAVSALDLGKRVMLDTLHGCAGSVRSLALHPGGEALLAATGLDRYVRVYDTRTRKQLAKLYMKQHLAAVAWAPVTMEERSPESIAADAAAAAEEHAAAVAEADEVWPQEDARVRRFNDEKEEVDEGVAANGARAGRPEGKRRKIRPKDGISN